VQAKERVLEDEQLDYFSIVSLLFYFGDSDKQFAAEIEDKLRREFLEKMTPRRNSQDCHLLLDLIACPHLSKGFRKECSIALLVALEISATHFSNVLLAEVERYPWFINWRQIDLLNHLRKKELRAVY
jgi:hypothetical protein